MILTSARAELTNRSTYGLGKSPEVVRIASMSVERATHQATLLSTGQVLITGGCAGQGCSPIHASAEVFEPATQSFRPVASMAIPRASHDATRLQDGRVLVTGGWTGERATGGAEIFDPETGQWTSIGDMTEPRVSHIAVLLTDGRVLIMGGGSGGLGNLDTAEIFDPATNTFSAIGRMHSNHYLATALADGRVLLTGGVDAVGRVSGAAEIFDPKTDAFIQTGTMVTPRVKHAAALLPDGSVLVVGGSDEGGYAGRYATTEIYNPVAGIFSRGPDMNFARHKIRDAVVTLPSGAILVAGGAVHPELFDPADHVFISAEGELSGPQMFATATLLPDGNVLVLGGYDHQTRSTASAWLVSLGEKGVHNETEDLPSRGAVNAYPNPFRERVSISVRLDRAVDSSLSAAIIYDVSGRRVRVLQPSQDRRPDQLTFEWDGTDDLGTALGPGSFLFVLGVRYRLSLTKVS